MPTVRLTECLRPGFVLWDLEVEGKTALLTTLAGHVGSRLKKVDEKDVLRSLEEREVVQSTGIGDGLALPHAIVPGVDGAVLFVVHLETPIDFAALDGQPVDLIFLLVSPPDGAKLHLRLLARLARLLCRPRFLADLRVAKDAGEAYRILADEDARHVY